MATMIYEQQESLRTLNASLEDRVQAKTRALQQKNQALEAEQIFSQGLLDSHEQFIRYAIHETHTPLSVIMANIELFTMNEGRNRYLAKIEAAVSSDIEACLFWVKSASQKIEDVHKIFEAYYRERKKSDGFGLGLNLVKSICDEERVNISIDSTLDFTQLTYQFPRKGEE